MAATWLRSEGFRDVVEVQLSTDQYDHQEAWKGPRWSPGGRVPSPGRSLKSGWLPVSEAAPAQLLQRVDTTGRQTRRALTSPSQMPRNKRARHEDRGNL
jgi:hypothetical protein